MGMQDGRRHPMLSVVNADGSADPEPDAEKWFVSMGNET
jgi:hypothetical protein